MSARSDLRKLRKEMDALATVILAKIGQDLELRDLFLRLDEFQHREEKLVAIALTELSRK